MPMLLCQPIITIAIKEAIGTHVGRNLVPIYAIPVLQDAYIWFPDKVIFSEWDGKQTSTRVWQRFIYVIFIYIYIQDIDL